LKSQKPPSEIHHVLTQKTTILISIVVNSLKVNFVIIMYSKILIIKNTVTFNTYILTHQLLHIFWHVYFYSNASVSTTFTHTISCIHTLLPESLHTNENGYVHMNL
jgi:hypothetical protein